MDEYLNEYIKFTIDNKEKTDNYNMTDNSYSDSNVRMTDREVDAYYEDYMERIENNKNNPRNNLRSSFDREGHTTWEAPEPDMVNNPDRYTPLNPGAYDNDMVKKDMVNSPGHYTEGSMEAITVMEAKLTQEQYRGYLQGAVLKYLLRCNYKGKRIEDLSKAQWYLDRLVLHLNQEERDETS